MIDNLKETIAHKLMASKIGMTLAELANSMPPEDYDNDRDRISARLNNLKVNNFVEKSGGFNDSPARWKITPRGRATYSKIHDDQNLPETPTQADPLSPISMDHRPQPESAAGEALQTTDHNSALVLDPVFEPGIAQNTQDTAQSQHQPIPTDEMARVALTQAGYIVLDPFSESDAFACSVIERLSNSNKPRIAYKTEKIALLQLARKSIGLFNSDAEQILDDIIKDLEKLEPAYANK